MWRFPKTERDCPDRKLSLQTLGILSFLQHLQKVCNCCWCFKWYRLSNTCWWNKKHRSFQRSKAAVMLLILDLTSSTRCTLFHKKRVYVVSFPPTVGMTDVYVPSVVRWVVKVLDFTQQYQNYSEWLSFNQQPPGEVHFLMNQERFIVQNKGQKKGGGGNKQTSPFYTCKPML